MASPPVDALLLNVGHVIINDNGNRVATIRIITGGYQMDLLTEFDCRKRRTRSISSVITDKNGQLVKSSGGFDKWFGGKNEAPLIITLLHLTTTNKLRLHKIQDTPYVGRRIAAKGRLLHSFHIRRGFVFFATALSYNLPLI